MTIAPSAVRRQPALVAGAAVSAVASVVALRAGERRLLESWSSDGRDGEADRQSSAALLGDARVHHVHTDDGAHLRVLDWGTGRPLILFHGITASCEDWLPVLPHLLDAGHRILAVDQRGHGASTLGASSCDTVRLAADAARIIEALDLRDAVVVGHSLGGYVALALAGLHPQLVSERVAALVLLGAPHTGRGVREVSTLLFSAAPWTPRLQRSDTHGAVVMGLVAFGRSPDRRDVDEVRYRWSRCAPATRLCFARALVGERVTPLLGRVDVPVVVARGTHDHIVTARRNAALIARLSRARGTSVEGAGHALLCEQPRAVAEVILDVAKHRIGSLDGT